MELEKKIICYKTGLKGYPTPQSGYVWCYIEININDKLDFYLMTRLCKEAVQTDFPDNYQFKTAHCTYSSVSNNFKYDDIIQIKAKIVPDDWDLIIK